ncbi:6905_t:CDS:1, partial [Funneliformis geosporum]
FSKSIASNIKHSKSMMIEEIVTFKLALFDKFVSFYQDIISLSLEHRKPLINFYQP